MSWSRTNQLIVRAAEGLGVRCEPLSYLHSDYFMRLSKAGRSVIISKTRSPFLTQVAQTLSNNKHVSRELIAREGIPVVPALLLDEQSDPRAADTWLERYGAVVVKPNWGNRGQGITMNVEDIDKLVRAYGRARAVDLDEEVLVEPQIDGTTLRIAVVGGQFEAAAEVRRVILVGDGERTIEELITELNRDSKRSSWRERALTSLDEIEIDADLEGFLATDRLASYRVLSHGRKLELPSEESETIDRTDDIDPGWGDLATRACRRLGVDVGGVDFCGTMDQFRNPPERGGPMLLEVNVVPALHFHALPTRGQPRPVFEAFVSYCLSLKGAPRPCATPPTRGAR